MFNNFNEVLDAAKKLGCVTVSVAAAHDEAALRAVKAAEDAGLINSILVGDEALIKPLAEVIGLSQSRIIHEPDTDQAALTAVKLVRQGDAQVLMKGLINSSDFLRAVLNPEQGLRSCKVLSHLSAFEIPGVKKLVFHTDSGINIAPNLEQKKEILINAIKALNIMGIPKPKVAVITANEQVNPKMPATTDAHALVEMSRAGELPACEIEGPIAMDVIASSEAAKHKGIESKIAGEVDLVLVPTIEVGNTVAKTLIHYAKAKNAGIILGATHPIVMVSRSDSSESKINSLALAAVVVGGERSAEND